MSVKRGASLRISLFFLILAFPGLSTVSLLTLLSSLAQGKLVLTWIFLLAIAYLLALFLPRPLRQLMKATSKKWRSLVFQTHEVAHLRKASRIAYRSGVATTLKESSATRTVKKEK